MATFFIFWLLFLGSLLIGELVSHIPFVNRMINNFLNKIERGEI